MSHGISSAPHGKSSTQSTSSPTNNKTVYKLLAKAGGDATAKTGDEFLGYNQNDIIYIINNMCMSRWRFMTIIMFHIIGMLLWSISWYIMVHSTGYYDPLAAGYKGSSKGIFYLFILASVFWNKLIYILYFVHIL